MHENTTTENVHSPVDGNSITEVFQFNLNKNCAVHSILNNNKERGTMKVRNRLQKDCKISPRMVIDYVVMWFRYIPVQACGLWIRFPLRPLDVDFYID